jgi:hypothetical protein
MNFSYIKAAMEPVLYRNLTILKVIFMPITSKKMAGILE